jgi:hypothetical protein
VQFFIWDLSPTRRYTFTQIPQMKADFAEAKEKGLWQFKGKDRPISLAKSAV